MKQVSCLPSACRRCLCLLVLIRHQFKSYLSSDPARHFDGIRCQQHLVSCSIASPGPTTCNQTIRRFCISRFLFSFLAFFLFLFPRKTPVSGQQTANSNAQTASGRRLQPISRRRRLCSGPHFPERNAFNLFRPQWPRPTDIANHSAVTLAGEKDNRRSDARPARRIVR